MVKKQAPRDKANKLKVQAKQKMQEAKNHGKNPWSMPMSDDMDMSMDMDMSEDRPRPPDSSRTF